MVARVVLGFFAVLAVIGGLMLTVMAVNYFRGSGYVPELNEIGGWGVVAGLGAPGVYTWGLVRSYQVNRVLAGVVVALLGFGASMTAAKLVSLTAGEGGPRGTLEDGALGFLWLVAGSYFLWVAVRGRRPVSATRE
ncbi:hypothetical protein [Lentzea sp.]|uniref:hypothetical protein n=1 Tax=Lentzea sp. TaxID=56099 RepID=UPI002ED1F8B4